MPELFSLPKVEFGSVELPPGGGVSVLGERGAPLDRGVGIAVEGVAAPGPLGGVACEALGVVAPVPVEAAMADCNVATLPSSMNPVVAPSTVERRVFIRCSLEERKPIPLLSGNRRARARKAARGLVEALHRRNIHPTEGPNGGFIS
jgi:hypothetical protein